MFFPAISISFILGVSRACFLSAVAVFWLVLALFMPLAQAGEVSDANELAARAMELSGARGILEGTGKSIDAQLASDPRVKKMTKQQRAELTALLKDTLDGRRMARELTTELAASGDVVRLREAIATMDEPNFRKVTRLTVAESIKATDKIVADYARGLGKRPPDPERVRLIQRLDAATDGSQVLADMRYEMAAQLFGGMQIPDREARLAQLRAQIEASAPEEYVIRALYSSRNLGIKELESYARAHESEAMGWLARQVGYGSQKVMLDAMGRMLGAILEVAARGR